jgi:gluconate kinase
MIDSAQKQSLRQNITTSKESLYMIGLHMSNEFFFFFLKSRNGKYIAWQELSLTIRMLYLTQTSLNY